MGTRKGTGGAGVRDGRTAATRVGLWYAEGPGDRRFVAGDPAFSILRVVSDDAAVPGCVMVENAAGQRFPVPIPLIDAIAASTEQQARTLLDRPSWPISAVLSVNNPAVSRHLGQGGGPAPA